MATALQFSEKTIQLKPVSAATLPYFRPEALKFLRNLPRHNERE
jgi:hypothetical protein